MGLGMNVYQLKTICQILNIEEQLICILDLEMLRKAKIIFLGESGVGKSSIISSIIGNQINIIHQPTIGMDFFKKNQQGLNGTYRLQIWDTAGQQRFRCILPSYIRNSKIGVLVYDITNPQTLQNIEKWIQMYRQWASQTSKIVIVGNKIDLHSEGATKIKQIQEKLDKYETKYTKHIEVSAKTSLGIRQLVQFIVSLLDQIKIQPQPNLNNNLKSDQSVRKCCSQV